MAVLHDMQRQLSGIVSGVRDSASQVTLASRQIAQGNAVSLSSPRRSAHLRIQENAALVEESAAAAETLSRQSADMVEAAAVFKLADDLPSERSTDSVVSQHWDDAGGDQQTRRAA